jgi:hypothetical protein
MNTRAACFRIELSWAKLAGVAALLVPMVPARLKEWPRLFGVFIMKWQVTLALLSFSTVAMTAGAQWTDPSTGLMWAGKDNGKDVSWKKAMKYCRDLRLAGYSDWRLATLAELEGIYDKSANAPGLARLGGPAKGSAFTFHVKGNLFLTGDQWSSSRLADDRGKPSGYASRFDFNEGRSFDGDELSFYTNKRALCVRGSRE